MSKPPIPLLPDAGDDLALRREKVARLKAEVQSGAYRIKSRELVFDLLKPIADLLD